MRAASSQDLRKDYDERNEIWKMSRHAIVPQSLARAAIQTMIRSHDQMVIEDRQGLLGRRSGRNMPAAQQLT